MMPSVMVTARQILKLADEIAKKFSPQRIILFGSYAYGKPDEDSDVDLMVVMNYRGRCSHLEARIRLALDRTISIDLLVRTERQLAHRVQIEDWFIVEIVERGLILYDCENPRMGRKGRSRLRRRYISSQIPQAQPV